MKYIYIKKAKFGDNNTVSYYDEKGNDITLRAANGPHPDLLRALRDLVPYFADLSQQKEADSIDWDNIHSELNDELLHSLYVTDFSITGAVDNRSVAMTGCRDISMGRVIKITTPALPLDQGEAAWDLLDGFKIALDKVLDEVELYIMQNKHSDVPSLFEETDPFEEKELLEVTAN